MLGSSTSEVQQMTGGNISRPNIAAQILSGFCDPRFKKDPTKDQPYTLADYRNLAMALPSYFPLNDQEKTIKEEDQKERKEVKKGFFTQMSEVYEKLNNEEKMVFLHNAEIFIKALMQTSTNELYLKEINEGMLRFFELAEKETNPQFKEKFKDIKDSCLKELSLQQSKHQKREALLKEDKKTSKAEVKSVDSLFEDKKRLRRSTFNPQSLLTEKKQRRQEEDEIANDLASDLWQYQMDYIRRLNFHDFRNLAWSKDKEFNTVINQMTDGFNKMKSMFVDKLLDAKDLKEQKKIYKVLIKTAEKCIERGDYQSAMAITLALTTGPIERLNYLKSNPKRAQKIAELERLYSQESSYKNLRERMDKSIKEGKAFVPSTVVYLQDLTFKEENKTFLEANNLDKPNEAKLNLVGTTLEAFRAMQVRAFEEPTVPYKTNLTSHIDRHVLDKRDQFEASLSILSREEKNNAAKKNRQPKLQFGKVISFDNIKSFEQLQAMFPDGKIPRNFILQYEGQTYRGKEAIKNLLTLSSPYLKEPKGLIQKEFAINFIFSLNNWVYEHNIKSEKIKDKIRDVTRVPDFTFDEQRKLHTLHELSHMVDEYSKLDGNKREENKQRIIDIKLGLPLDGEQNSGIINDDDRYVIAQAAKALEVIGNIDKVIEIEKNYSELMTDFEKVKKMSQKFFGDDTLFSYLSEMQTLKEKLAQFKQHTHPAIQGKAKNTILEEASAKEKVTEESLKSVAVKKINFNAIVGNYTSLLKEKRGTSDTSEVDEKLKEIEYGLKYLLDENVLFEGGMNRVKVQQIYDDILKIKNISNLMNSYQLSEGEAKDNLIRKLSSYYTPTAEPKAPTTENFIASLYDETLINEIKRVKEADRKFLQGTNHQDELPVDTVLKSLMSQYVKMKKSDAAEPEMKLLEQKIDAIFNKINEISANSTDELKIEANKFQNAYQDLKVAYQALKAYKPHSANETTQSRAKQNIVKKLLQKRHAIPDQKSTLIEAVEVAAKLRSPAINDLVTAKAEAVFEGLSDAYYQFAEDKQVLQRIFPRATTQQLFKYIIQNVSKDPIPSLNQSLYALENLQALTLSENKAKEKAQLYDAYYAKMMALIKSPELSDLQKTSLVKLFNELQLMSHEQERMGPTEQKAFSRLYGYVKTYYDFNEMKLTVADKELDLGVAIRAEVEEVKKISTLLQNLENIQTLPTQQEKVKKFHELFANVQNTGVHLKYLPSTSYKDAISAYVLNDEQLFKSIFGQPKGARENTEEGFPYLDKQHLAINCMTYLGDEKLKKLLLSKPDVYLSLFKASGYDVQELSKVYASLTKEENQRLHEIIHQYAKERNYDAFFTFRGFELDPEFKNNGKTIMQIIKENAIDDPRTWKEIVFQKPGYLEQFFLKAISKKIEDNKQQLQAIAPLLASLSSAQPDSLFHTGIRMPLTEGLLLKSDQPEVHFSNFIKASMPTTRRQGGTDQLTRAELLKLQKFNNAMTRLLYPSATPNLQKADQLAIERNQLNVKIKELEDEYKKLNDELEKKYGVPVGPIERSKFIEEFSHVPIELFDKRESLEAQLSQMHKKEKLLTQEFDKYEGANKDREYILRVLRGADGHGKEGLSQGDSRGFMNKFGRNPAVISLIMDNLDFLKQINEKYQAYAKLEQGVVDEQYVQHDEKLKTQYRERQAQFKREVAEKTGKPLETQEALLERTKTNVTKSWSDRPLFKIHNAIDAAKDLPSLVEAMAKITNEHENKDVVEAEINKAIIYNLEQKVDTYLKQPAENVTSELLVKYVEAKKRNIKIDDELHNKIADIWKNINSEQRSKILQNFKNPKYANEYAEAASELVRAHEAFVAFDKLKTLPAEYYKNFKLWLVSPSQYDAVLNTLGNHPIECKKLIDDALKNADNASPILLSLKAQATDLAPRVDSEIKRFAEVTNARSEMKEELNEKSRSQWIAKFMDVKEPEKGLEMLAHERYGVPKQIRRNLRKVGNQTLRKIRSTFNKMSSSQTTQNTLPPTSPVSSVESVAGNVQVKTSWKKTMPSTKSQSQKTDDLPIAQQQYRLLHPSPKAIAELEKAIQSAENVSALIAAFENYKPYLRDSDGTIIDKEKLTKSLKDLFKDPEVIEDCAKGRIKFQDFFPGSHGLQEKISALVQESYQRNLKDKKIDKESTGSITVSKPDERKAFIPIHPSQSTTPILHQDAGTLAGLSQYLTIDEGKEKHGIVGTIIGKKRGFKIEELKTALGVQKVMELNFVDEKNNTKFTVYAHESMEKKGIVFSLAANEALKDPQKFKEAMEKICELAVMNNAGKDVKFEIPSIASSEQQMIVKETVEEVVKKAGSIESKTTSLKSDTNHRRV